MDRTDRLSLPLIMPGQAQKELFHNEALLALDTIVAGVVEGPSRNDPPATAIVGQCFIIGGSPSGDWSGFPDHLATFTSAGWRFIAPTIGLTLLDKSTETYATYGSSGWQTGQIRGSSVLIGGNQVVGPRADPIAAPQGGQTVDVEARACTAAILAVLRQHGLISP